MNIISAEQFDRRQIQDIFSLVHSPVKLNKILSSLFDEPSTRTRLSFEVAMYRLGGNVVSTENASQFSSAIKGETLEDSIKVVSSYVDIIVLRHPERNSAERAVRHSSVPIINAGSGDGEHPTQALLDVYTVQKEMGRMDLHYCLVGDLKHGRTIHSLIYLLGLYEGVKITLVSLDELRLPEEILKFIKDKGISYKCMDSLPEAISERPDVVYMTRLQKERTNISYAGYDSFQLNRELMSKLKDDSIVLHPLPRNHELPVELDGDRRIACFRQAANGIEVRSAIILGCFYNV